MMQDYNETGWCCRPEAWHVHQAHRVEQMPVPLEQTYQVYNILCSCRGPRLIAHLTEKLAKNLMLLRLTCSQGVDHCVSAIYTYNFCELGRYIYPSLLLDARLGVGNARPAIRFLRLMCKIARQC